MVAGAEAFFVLIWIRRIKGLIGFSAIVGDITIAVRLTCLLCHWYRREKSEFHIHR